MTVVSINACLVWQVVYDPYLLLIAVQRVR